MGICRKCRDDLMLQMLHVCKICGTPLRTPLEICQDCRRNMYYFDAGRSLGVYGGHLKHAINRMKYYGERWLSRPLGLLLGEMAQSFFDADIVVPVPIESRSKKARGYNQAKDLAAGVACKTYLPLTDILVRKAPREHQARLGRAGRWQNLRGTIETLDTGILKGARVLLVDDVITTGATLDEAARALKAAGASKVVFVTLARTLKD